MEHLPSSMEMDNDGDDELEEGQNYVLVRNQKYKDPPAIHDHAMRNPFGRDFDPNSIMELEKNLQKEIFVERAQMTMVVKKKPDDEFFSPRKGIEASNRPSV